MLKKILDRKTCVQCKWCCVFDRSDHWETPLIIEENVEPLRRQFPDAHLTLLNTDYKLDLGQAFEKDKAKEFAYCPFLDQQTGCVLSEERKPFDCKIWPLRVMRKAEQLVLTLTPTCPACNALQLETMKEFVQDDLAETIGNYAKQHPDMILIYREGYPVLDAL